MSDNIIFAMLQVIEEIIKLKRSTTNNKKRIWVKKWIARRHTLGASNSLLRELSIEDPKSYHNFLRINEDMFNTLLNKV